MLGICLVENFTVFSSKNVSSGYLSLLHVINVLLLDVYWQRASKMKIFNCKLVNFPIRGIIFVKFFELNSYFQYSMENYNIFAFYSCSNKFELC